MPQFSILTPVFNPPLYALEECAQSVFNQSLTDWEWCLVDDGSTDPDIVAYLNQLTKLDRRIRVSRRDDNGGIIAASQDALISASGDFIVLLDHDDMLHHEALERVSLVIEAHEDVDYIYSDEDKIDQHGQHFDEFLKPDWSPERLRGQNYCCHLSTIRRIHLFDVGGFREGFEGSQDYDLILRVTETARRIFHIPEVLYHWRAIPGSTASSADEKPHAFIAAQQAVSQHLDRVGIVGHVEDAGFGYHRVIRAMSSNPLISIIIPTCGSRSVIAGVDTCLVLNTVKSIISSSTYRNFELVIVADDHTPQYVIDDLYADFGTFVQIVTYRRPFNFSDKCNEGFVHSKGDLIMLLNDDVQVITSDWLETLAALALESDVGLVGPMLLFESGLIQSAGHSNTPSPHNFRNGVYPDQPGEFGVLSITRESSGVTGAAAMCRRAVYDEVGGLSVTFPNCFNDVDFAFKILEKGYRILWTPFARLYHFESATRDATVDQKELMLLMDRWGRKFDDDRFIRLN